MATSLITGATGTGSVTANQKVLDMADKIYLLLR